MAIKQAGCSVPAGKAYIGQWGGVLQKALPSGGTRSPQTTLIQNQYIGMSGESSINYSFAEDSFSNGDNKAGGPGCSYKELSKATLTLKVQSFHSFVQALSLLGTAVDIASGAVTNELHSIIKNTASAIDATSGTLIPFMRAPNTAQTITVTNVAGTTTYVAGTDYVVTDTGLLVPPTSSIANATGPNYDPTFKVSYTALDTQRVDGLVKLQEPVSLYFDGFDRASGAVRQGWIYRALGTAKASPVKSPQKLVQIDFDFELLPDDRIPYNASSPESQYFHFFNS